VYVRVATVWKQ